MSEINPLSNNLQNQSGLEGNSSLDEPKLTAKKTIYFHRKKFYTQSILIALALICIVVLLGQLLESGFLAAMCLLVGIFSMPVFSKELRQDKNILLGYFFVIGSPTSPAKRTTTSASAIADSSFSSFNISPYTKWKFFEWILLSTHWWFWYNKLS